MTVAIAIRTCDRRPAGLKNYLGDTLRNLERGGLWKAQTPWSLVIVDGGSRPGYIRTELPAGVISDPWVRIAAAPDRVRTPNENGAATWREACADDAADWVLVLEDDIDVCADFLDETARWLETHARDDRRVYPLGCPHRDVVTAAAAGQTSWEYPIGHYWASQATVVRRPDAIRLAAYLEAHPIHGVGAQATTQSHDWILPDWARTDYPAIAHFLTPAPGLVQHIGRQSLLAINRLKQSPQAIVFFDFPSWRGRA